MKHTQAGFYRVMPQTSHVKEKKKANTRVVYIVSRSKKKTEQNRNDEKYSQTGITVKTHTNHDGVMLRSTAASSSWRSLIMAAK